MDDPRADPHEFEETVFRLVSDVLRAFGDPLKQAGLRPDFRLSRGGSGARYLSEVEIYVWRETDDGGPDIADVIEHIIWWKGEPRATPEELAAWVEEQLRELLEADAG